MLSSDEGIKLGFFGGKVVGTLPGSIDGITPEMDVGT